MSHFAPLPLRAEGCARDVDSLRRSHRGQALGIVMLLAGRGVAGIRDEILPQLDSSYRYCRVPAGPLRAESSALDVEAN